MCLLDVLHTLLKMNRATLALRLVPCSILVSKFAVESVNLQFAKLQFPDKRECVPTL